MFQDYKKIKEKIDNNLTMDNLTEYMKSSEAMHHFAFVLDLLKLVKLYIISKDANYDITAICYEGTYHSNMSATLLNRLFDLEDTNNSEQINALKVRKTFDITFYFNDEDERFDLRFEDDKMKDFRFIEKGEEEKYKTVLEFLKKNDMIHEKIDQTHMKTIPTIWGGKKSTILEEMEEINAEFLRQIKITFGLTDEDLIKSIEINSKLIRFYMIMDEFKNSEYLKDYLTGSINYHESIPTDFDFNNYPTTYQNNLRLIPGTVGGVLFKHRLFIRILVLLIMTIIAFLLLNYYNANNYNANNNTTNINLRKKFNSVCLF